MWSFTTGDTTVSSLWPETAVPANSDGGDTNAVELGVKFQVSAAGVVEGVRFYKSGEHRHPRRSQWRADGTGLADVTFNDGQRLAVRRLPAPCR